MRQLTFSEIVEQLKGFDSLDSTTAQKQIEKYQGHIQFHFNYAMMRAGRRIREQEGLKEAVTTMLTLASIYLGEDAKEETKPRGR